ncbi:MAG: NAD-dependent epimerase/dehydratase [Parcubacteria group bacterium GW2011_GWB1_56_8]|nr:MAG: NAD-dependent epimerase/dehydratase [Parcubacteria group bacterium GW2011_GWB1_56_8]
MRVLVTGAMGFIGSHVVDALVRDGHDVVGLDSLDKSRHPDGQPGYLSAGARYVSADLRSDLVLKLMAPEAVVHLAALGGVARAAREPAEVIDANVLGTVNLVETIRERWNVNVAILISSFSVYGSGYTYQCLACSAKRDASRSREQLDRGQYEVICDKCGGNTGITPIAINAPLLPLETYGATKLAQERAFVKANTCCNVRILRLSSVYGSRMQLHGAEATILGHIIGQIQKGVGPSFFEDGKQTRDWVWVGDVVDSVRMALGRKGEAITNVCSGHATSLLDAARMAASIIGVDVEPVVVGGHRAGDMRHCLGDPSQMQLLIGRSSTKLDDGLQQWLR